MAAVHGDHNLMYFVFDLLIIKGYLIVIVRQPLQHILANRSKTLADREKVFGGNMSGYALITLCSHSCSTMVNE